MRLTLVACVCTLFLGTHAFAQQPATITRDKSKLILNMPGLENSQETYQYFGWSPNYSQETSYAANIARGKTYPRAQVYGRILQPGFVWTRLNDLDEKWIKGFAPFFNDRAVKITRAAPSGSDNRSRTVRFEIDATECVGFSMMSAVGIMLGQTSTSASPNIGTSGIYCADLGTKLTDEIILAVLSGWKYVPNPAAN